MKNTQIKNLSEVVPKEIRLQVYKKVRDYYLSEDYEYKGIRLGFGLCISLPTHLWGLKSFDALSPDRKEWDHEDTSNAFPELTNYVIEDISGCEETFKKSLRVNYLEQWISELEKS